ncbi:hypothetical protein D3C76_1505490 [compost metagenome]
MKADNIIDYRDIYDRLKDIPADRLKKELNSFEKLYQWKMNDIREGQRKRGN